MRTNNFIGIDIGCTNIRFIATIYDTIDYKSFKTGDNITKAELIGIITDLVKSYNLSFNGIGIAFSGITVDGKTIKKTHLNALKDFTVKDLSHLPCNNIKLINCSNATAIAGSLEYPDEKVVVGITNGTGIGLGVVKNGEPIIGANGAFGEIYDSYTMTKDGFLQKIGKILSGGKIYKAKNPKSFFNDSLPYWKALLSQIIKFYDPNVIYFSGGGFTYHPEIISEAFSFLSKEYPDITSNLLYSESIYGDYAGCFGAKHIVETDAYL